MEEAKQRKDEELRRQKQEVEIEEARVKQERIELEEKYAREETERNRKR